MTRRLLKDCATVTITGDATIVPQEPLASRRGTPPILQYRDGFVEEPEEAKRQQLINHLM